MAENTIYAPTVVSSRVLNLSLYIIKTFTMTDHMLCKKARTDRPNQNAVMTITSSVVDWTPLQYFMSKIGLKSLAFLITLDISCGVHKEHQELYNNISYYMYHIMQIIARQHREPYPNIPDICCTKVSNSTVTEMISAACITCAIVDLTILT